ncbi:MAG: ATP-dependent zinc metalloprotease FtsH [Gemmataceae bacterium]
MPAPREQNPNQRNRRRQEAMPGGWLWIIILLLLAAVMYFTLGFSGDNVVNYTDFLAAAKSQQFKLVIFKGSNRLIGELKEGEEAKLPDPVKKKVRGNKIETYVPEAAIKSGSIDHLLREEYKVPEIRVEEESGSWLGSAILFLLPTLLLVGFFVFFLLPRFRDPLGGGFLSNYVKSPAKRYDKTKTRTTFDDVADMTSAKYELQEIVEFLKNPEKFQKLGAQIPKGVLLIGPPGTGKTLLARAVAGEAGVPFYSISGSEFIQMFVGVGASRVRDMFKTAKENAPCLLFIDEIDAVGRMRGAGLGGGSDEREQTLNQILSEMDGFTPNESVIVVAATNRPDVLDSALLRPGRFDRHVTVDRPNAKGRLDILKVHTRNKPLAEEVNLEDIAKKMIGMTGADLRNLANEAALVAARDNKTRIERTDFERAADRIILGAKKDSVPTEEAKRITAYHEAGHALTGYYVPRADPPHKISIVPRGMTGGVTWLPHDEDRILETEDYLKARLITAMGGRAAERLVFGHVSSGAQGDLKTATRQARYMVTHYGMSERLGPMSFRIGEEHLFLGKEIQEPRDFSETTAAIIDEEVQKLLREADQSAYRLLQERRPELEKLVKALMEKEELYKEEIEEILGGPRAKPAGEDRAAAIHEPISNGPPPADTSIPRPQGDEPR